MFSDGRFDQARPLRAGSGRRDVAPDADEEMLVLIARPVACPGAVLRPDEVRSILEIPGRHEIFDCIMIAAIGEPAIRLIMIRTS